MSKVVLSDYPDHHGEWHVVVGWDQMQGTFYWQVFNPPDVEPEVSAFGGYENGEYEELPEFEAALPDEVKALMDDDVRTVLYEHRSGLSDPNVIVHMEDR
jgi:hypothetical protein